MNMTTTVVQARVDASLKKEVEEVLAGLELDLPEAIRIFFRQVANRGTLPFELVQKEDMFCDEAEY
jgi:addiction module RelB/DinJ family antitoxin